MLMYPPQELGKAVTGKKRRKEGFFTHDLTHLLSSQVESCYSDNS